MARNGHLTGKPLSGIGEIGHAEIEIDVCDLRADTARHSELSGWLGRQLDGGHYGASVDRTKGKFFGLPTATLVTATTIGSRIHITLDQPANRRTSA